MKTLSRCKNNIEADNVILIDVDNYDLNNVAVIDIPESHTKKQGVDKRRPLRTYIYIDDDDDDVSPCDHNVGENLDGERIFENGASSSRRYCSEKPSPVKLSKGKRTYSGRGSNAGLNTGSSDDDSPDCELMEDFAGKLREQWERAFMKRKGVVHNDHASASKNENKQHEQGSNVNGVKDDIPLSETPSNSSEEVKRTYENTDSSDDDSPDCQVMEDFPEKQREQWEREFSKKKGVVHNDHSKFVVNENKQHDQGFNRQSDSDSSEDDGFDCRLMEDFPEKLKEQWDQEFMKRKGFVYNDHASASKNDSKQHDQGSTSSEEENEKNDPEIAATVDDDDDVPDENSIIGEREKLKETDEYKRALEEELLARQKALQIQAEEAQQLRRLQKRKRAEGLRLLDMERRQKQRVEEIRETQKKDEENMNLKEQYRAEVRQELQRLEFICLDMASLLRALGIQVGNGPIALPNEVRVAYKRALLSFHPDRASGSDMRQQVEAEEKFKLISRMKEKFSL